MEWTTVSARAATSELPDESCGVTCVEPKFCAAAPDGEVDQNDSMAACSIAGCSCQGFVGQGNDPICQNCGHQYADHWG
jgi:hypothetical protein